LRDRVALSSVSSLLWPGTESWTFIQLVLVVAKLTIEAFNKLRNIYQQRSISQQAGKPTNSMDCQYQLDKWSKMFTQNFGHITHVH
jgi:hypothetical protein